MEYLGVMVGNLNRKYPVQAVKLMEMDPDGAGANVFVNFPPSNPIGLGRINQQELAKLLTYRLEGNSIHLQEPESNGLLGWLEDEETPLIGPRENFWLWFRRDRIKGAEVVSNHNSKFYCFYENDVNDSHRALQDFEQNSWQSPHCQ